MLKAVAKEPSDSWLGEAVGSLAREPAREGGIFRFETVRGAPPTWLLSRLLIRSQVRIWLAGAEICPGKVGRRIVLELIARQSLGQGDLHVRPGERIVGVSVNALAASLGAPFETVRRQVKALVAQGDCRIVEGRCVLSPHHDRAAVVDRYLEALANEAVLLIEDFQQAGVLSPEFVDIASLQREDLISAALDISLVAVENNQGEMENWYQLILVGAVHTLNLDHILSDRRLSLELASELLSDDMRQPASCTRIATFLSLPYHTVRRQLQQAIRHGTLEETAGGFIVPSRYICDPRILEIGEQSVRYACSRLRRLAG